MRKINPKNGSDYNFILKNKISDKTISHDVIGKVT